MTDTTKRRGRPAGAKNKSKVTERQVEWEKLARQLQEALELQIHDNIALDEDLKAEQLKRAAVEEEFKLAKLHFVNLEKSHKHLSIILSYLETKIGLDSIRGD